MLLEIIDYINKGGVISYILIVLYLLVMSITVERIIYFITTKSNFCFIKKILEDSIKNKNIHSFESNKWTMKYKKNQSVRIINFYIENMNLEKDAFNEALEREAFFEIASMERRIWLIAQIGHIAPLLGLLGTVIGLIESFQIMSSLGAQADVAQFASGIWVAMITTAIGLIVAIPSFFIFRVFERLIEKRSAEMSGAISILNENYSNKIGSSITLLMKNNNSQYDGEIHENF